MMTTENLLYAKLNLETAPIAWKELLKFFASGSVLFVSSELDLVQVAVDFSNDNSKAIETLLNNQQLAPVSDKQALHWFEHDTTLWSVVVKPWILVQELPEEQQKTVQ